MELFEFQVIKLKGTSKYPPKELERKLRVILEKVGTVDELVVVTPPAEDPTFISLAVTWGYIENYVDYGDILNEHEIAEVTGMKPSTSIRRLRALKKAGVLTGGPYEFKKARDPEWMLKDWLKEHPLYMGNWEPKHWTFPHEGREAEAIERPEYVPIKLTPGYEKHLAREERRNKVKEVTRLMVTNIGSVPTLAALKDGKAKTTRELAKLTGLNRSSVHRTLTRYLEKGIVELDQSGTVNTWRMVETWRQAAL